MMFCDIIMMLLIMLDVVNLNKKSYVIFTLHDIYIEPSYLHISACVNNSIESVSLYHQVLLTITINTVYWGICHIPSH